MVAESERRADKCNLRWRGRRFATLARDKPVSEPNSVRSLPARTASWTSNKRLNASISVRAGAPWHPEGSSLGSSLAPRHFEQGVTETLVFVQEGRRRRSGLSLIPPRI